MNINNKDKSILQMLICAFLWSIAGILMKWIPWNGFAVASLRSFFAALTFIVYMYINRLKFIINKNTVISGIFTGLVYVCFACSNKLTTAANAIVLQFTSPIFILLINAFVLKKSILKKDIIAVAATLIGISLFFFDELEKGYIIGNIVAVFSGIFMAAMFVCVGTVKNEEKYSSILIGQLVAFTIGFPAVIISKPAFTAVPVIYIIVLGVLQLGISYILYVKSSAYCPPLACCLLGGLEPLLNPVWVLIFDGEKPGIFALIGGIIVIISVTCWCISNVKDENISA